VRQELRHLHLQGLLQELEVAELHAVQGKKIVEDQRKRARRLRDTTGPDTPATCNADTLLRVIEDTQKLFEGHVDLIKREVATET
jgi:hypothetical protein